MFGLSRTVIPFLRTARGSLVRGLSLTILGATVVVGVLIVVDAGVADADMVRGRRRRNSSQIVLVQVKGIGRFAEVALYVVERYFRLLDEAQCWPIIS